MVKHIGQRTTVSKAFLKASEVDASELPDRLRILQEYLLDAVENDCRRFTSTISDWKENEVFKHFNPTWEDFIATHIKQPIEWIDHMMQGVQLLDQTKPIRGQDAIAAAKAVGRPAKPEGAPVEHRPATLAKAAKVKELRAKGMTQQQVADQSGLSKSHVDRLESLSPKKSDNVTVKKGQDKPQSSQRGNAKSWTIAKLRREGKDDIAAQVESGAMSAAEARRQVFGEKPAKTFSVGPTTDPQDFALRLKDGLSDEFLSKLTTALNELVSSNLG
jgi:hypothetical protein